MFCQNLLNLKMKFKIGEYASKSAYCLHSLGMLNGWTTLVERKLLHLSLLSTCAHVMSMCSAAMNESHSTLVFFVNGKKIEDSNVDPEWTLLYYLKNKLKLTGTKLGCGEGGCGACTVMLSKYDRQNDCIDHIAINACLTPLCSLHGLAITTTEGIGNMATKLHPVQERIAKSHGSQCGFCTPGIVMSMYTLLRNNPKPSMKDLDVAFQGNLCRCTGYRAILEGYKTFTEDYEIAQRCKTTSSCAMGNQCCKNMKKEKNDLFDANKFAPYIPSQEPIFPPELKLNSEYDKEELMFKGKNVQWLRPKQLKDLLMIKHENPDCKIVVGNTEVGVETKFRRIIYPVLVQPTNIPEMTSIIESPKGLLVGASVTLQNLEIALREQMKIKNPHQTRLFASIVDMLHYFAGKQIRNVAAVGGNIMTSSPISDLLPIFTAANCVLDVCSKTRGTRKLCMNSDFFVGYRQNLIEKDEILTAIHIPFTTENQYFYAYKQSKRRDDDIAIVNCAVNVTFEENSTVINDIKIAYGGMSITPVLAENTQKALICKPWNEDTLELAYTELVKDLPLFPDAPGGNIHYRRSLTLSLFFRAYLAICQQLQAKGCSVNLPTTYLSGIEGFHHKVPHSSQYFQVLPGEKMTDYVGKPIPHVAALKQTCGEAIYCDDLPVNSDELYMGLVLSTEAHAKILSINATEALDMEGVHAFFSAKDLTPQQNQIKPIFNDEEVFRSKLVTAKGQTIGIIIADNQNIAQLAAKKVKITYKKLSPVIVTIEQAIDNKSFLRNEPTKIVNGDVEEAFKNADHVITGQCRTGAQEHFYLETHSIIVNPKNEDNEFDVYCSTQHPQEVSNLIAGMLEIPVNRVVTRVKRLGGGFGGKESRSLIIALPAAVAACKLGRPIRIMLDRDEDMAITGSRHPFLIKYKTAFNNDGKILGCKIKIYSNAGYSADLSQAVLERAMFHFENAYKIPNVEVLGWTCKTNLPSNTAFRGFGGPQGMFAAENMIRDIADYLNKDIKAVQELNLYKECDKTHYNQELTYCTLDRCWEECITMAEYEKRKSAIEKYNLKNRWKKRGIALVPTKFGIAFTFLRLNQAGALVIVYADGSVLLSHGGVEMGQGLHTKMIQIASKCLGIPVSKIYIAESATDKVPNASATAASAGSDLNGMAVKEACEVIMNRIEPLKKKYPEASWEDLIKTAYNERIGLSATGFHATPDIGYDFETNSGNPFNYFTYGVACSEVEIDCLTGDHQVLSTNIVMDLGESLNPAIDVGQVEGAFVQGCGMFTMEEMLYSPDGDVITKGPGSYKIPGFGDIPIEFNVSLLKGAPNPRAIFSSKAVGEPPLFLASSVLFAIKEAIKSARVDAGIQGNFILDAPATSARIRVLCKDNLTSKFEMPDPSNYTPWNVIP